MVPPAFRFGKREKFPLRNMAAKNMSRHVKIKIRLRDAEVGFKLAR